MRGRRDGRSAEAARYHRLYKTARWKRLKEAHKAAAPDNALCRYCLEQGRTTAMHSVDHIRPHRGDETLFFDPANLQSLCKLHHSSTKQTEERAGRRIGCDINGRPLGEDHPWRRGA